MGRQCSPSAQDALRLTVGGRQLSQTNCFWMCCALRLMHWAWKAASHL